MKRCELSCKLLFALCLIILLPTAVSAKIIYVRTHGSDSSNGANWSAAKKWIQSAINVAASGDEIWVAAGTYPQCLTLKSGIALYGGFIGTETSRSQRNWKKNITIIDGNGEGSVVTAINCYKDTTVDGFTVTNGIGTLIEDARYGGGFYCIDSSMTIVNCDIKGNSAMGPDPHYPGAGGGIYCEGGSATVLYTMIRSNSTSTHGSVGGIRCSDGSFVISWNYIAGNDGGMTGGGYVSGDAVITNNVFYSNSSIYDCSALYVDGTSFVCNNVFSDNFHDYWGYSLGVSGGGTVANNTIVNNLSSDPSDVGGGVHISDGYSTLFVNNIVAYNTAGLAYSEEPGWLELRNNCVFGNIIYNYSGVSPGATDLQVDPKLTDIDAGNYHIQVTSPCRDKGDDSVVGSDWYDMDSQARVSGAHVDIGADEYGGSPPVNVSITPNSGGLAVNAKYTIATKYSDLDGYNNLKYCYLIVNTSLSGAECLCVRYNANTNKIYMKNDNDSAWLGGYAPGSDNTIENSYCKVYCKETTKAGSGKEYTISWSILFKPTMSGRNCGAWLYVSDDTDLGDGWDKVGTLKISRKPDIVSVSPSSGMIPYNSRINFSTRYSDGDGSTNLSLCYLLIDTSLDGRDCVYLKYDAITNRLHVRNNTNTLWSAGYQPGSTAVLSNDQFYLYCKDTAVSKSGNDLIIKWSIQLKSIMEGRSCGIWMKVVDSAGLIDGWEQKGTVKVDRTPVNVSLSPAFGTLVSGFRYTIRSAYSDADGYNNISQCCLLINAALDGRNCAYLKYDANANKLYVKNNANTLWIGGYAPGSDKTIENSYCKLYCKDTTLAKLGNNLTVNWRLELKSGMSGKSCGAWMRVWDDVGMYSNWDKKGGLTIK